MLKRFHKGIIISLAIEKGMIRMKANKYLIFILGALVAYYMVMIMV